MKQFLHGNMIFAIVFSLLASWPVSVYSGENEAKPCVLMLRDGAGDYPVLKNLFEDGFFAEDNLGAVYIPYTGTGGETNRGRDILLTSSLKRAAGDESASFSLLVTDPHNRDMSIEWDVPGENDSLRDASLLHMIRFAEGIRKSGMPDAVFETEDIVKRISEINVRYIDDQKETAAAGYDIKFNTGISPTHRFVRTLVLITLMNSIGVANYWINKDDNMEDWRYKYRWEDVGPRILDGWSYDTNAFRTNSLYHYYAGAVYYQAARSNEYGILASTAWSFFGSFLWEYVGEWREQTSANDMVFTPFGGSVMGEAFYQTSLFIENNLPHSVYGKIFACILDPMRFVNRGLDSCFNDNFRVRIVFANPAAQAIMEMGKKR